MRYHPISVNIGHMAPKTPTLVYLDEAMANGLERLKTKTGASKGELIRRAIADYLEKQGVSEGAKADRKRAITRKRP